MITLAFIAAAVVIHRRAPRVGIDPDKMVGFYALSIFLGLVGARLLHFLMATPAAFFANPSTFFDLGSGGFAFYGGFILAGLGAVAYGRWNGIDPWKLADVAAPAVMLGLALGRIGCFSAGCCHGMPLTLPADAVPLFPDSFGGGQLWAFGHFPFLAEMTRHGVGHNDVVVYPTQLFESAAALLIFGLGSVLWRHRRFDGMVVGAVLVLYAIWRPINESLRGDEIRGTDYFGLLTTSQVVSIPVLVLGVAILLFKARAGVAPERPFSVDDDEPVSRNGTVTDPSVGDTLRLAVSVVARNIGIAVFIAALVGGLGWTFASFVSERVLAWWQPTSAQQTMAVGQFSEMLALAGWESTVGAWGAAAAIYLGVQRERGEPATLRGAVNYALTRLSRVLPAHARAVIAIRLGMIVIVPGILFGLQYAFVDAVATLDPEERRPLARSRSLTAGRRRKLLLTFTPFLLWWLPVQLGGLPWLSGVGPWAVALGGTFDALLLVMLDVCMVRYFSDVTREPKNTAAPVRPAIVQVRPR